MAGVRDYISYADWDCMLVYYHDMIDGLIMDIGVLVMHAIRERLLWSSVGSLARHPGSSIRMIAAPGKDPRGRSEISRCSEFLLIY